MKPPQCFPEAKRTSTIKADIASEILACAAKGERDPTVLKSVALSAVVEVRAIRTKYRRIDGPCERTLDCPVHRHEPWSWIALGSSTRPRKRSKPAQVRHEPSLIAIGTGAVHARQRRRRGWVDPSDRWTGFRQRRPCGPHGAYFGTMGHRTRKLASTHRQPGVVRMRDR
jgi:hypothetical protein